MRAMRPLPLLAAFALAACARAPEAPPADPRPGATGAAVPPPAEAPRLDPFGLWVVDRIEEAAPGGAAAQDLSRHHVMLVLVGHRAFHGQSQCVPFPFRYTLDGDRIAIAPEHLPGPVCARGLTPEEQAFARIVPALREVVPDGEGRLRLTGPAGSLHLHRPPGGRVPNPFGNHPPAGPELVWGRYRLVEAGGVAADPALPVEFAVAYGWIEARAGCRTWRWTRVPDDPTVAAFIADPQPGPECQRMAGPSEAALERLMPEVRSISGDASGRARLAAPAGTILLAPF
jgi:hypothetical protein